MAFNKPEALEMIDEQTAAVIIELVQGEGGVHIATPEWVAALQERCRETGALLIVDEVQTGFGRTGRLFACEHYALQPDILCLAKSMAAGFPMGGVLVNDRIRVPLGKHGSTFGGNPLACAVGLRVLDILENESLMEQANIHGAKLVHRLEQAELAIIGDIRQLGLMIGIQLKTRVRPILGKLAEAGVLALPAGPKVLRLLPPLVISEDQVELLAQRLLDVLQT